MALDVYVGSLTRYYAGNWKNATQQAGREPPAGRARPEREPDVEHIQAEVLAWREALAASLASVGEGSPVVLEWDEAPDAPYFSDRPGWDGFGALVLWAAYAEHPALSRPAALAEDWDDDPALVRSNAEGFRSRYSHLVRNVEMWLPVRLQYTFEGEDAEGRRIVIGSAETLAAQLAELNAATWKGTEAEVARWRLDVPGDGTPLELQARYAFAVLSGLTRQAVQHRLPMKLDF